MNVIPNPSISIESDEPTPIPTPDVRVTTQYRYDLDPPVLARSRHAERPYLITRVYIDVQTKDGAVAVARRCYGYPTNKAGGRTANGVLDLRYGIDDSFTDPFVEDAATRCTAP